ncbi:hypothetical protein KUTeg_000877 [Tegillarca granosa]|uniref:C-type lectin domain-containing protein n=1 Tax=Tegillarca granosa TaxID=220873 RepID=A0ABQ9FXV5_TEGGR|nr:hypothetical protein KUTeg_000877 [Tegillarca granosa]
MESKSDTICRFLQATLARVENQHVQDFLVKKLEEPKYSAGDAFWIDANDFEQNNVWLDYQGNALTYTNWGPHQPDNRHDAESCVVIRRDYNFNYKWSDNLCDEEFYYICQKSFIISVHIYTCFLCPTKSTFLVGLVYGACPSGWEADGSKCYLISRDNETMPAALTICRFLQARLATVENKHVQDFLVKKLEEPKYSAGDAFWIDANDFEQENVWVDYQGNALTYTNWGPHQPNNQYGTESCVVIRRDFNFNYKWSDNHCDEEFYYICEKSSVASPGIVG